MASFYASSGVSYLLVYTYSFNQLKIKILLTYIVIMQHQIRIENFCPYFVFLIC